jgi:hypothetical protein
VDALAWRRHVTTVYALWMALLIVGYYALPGLRIVTWTALGLSGVVAIVAGVLLNRPSRKAPWLLLGAANLSFAVGQLIFLVYGVLKEVLPFSSGGARLAETGGACWMRSP